MTTTFPITVCVTTKNNEETIKRCLESVYHWVDEIVVVDSYSTDDTIGICRSYDADIYQTEFTGFADIKNRAISNASNEWVLILDSDEWVKENFWEEVQKRSVIDGDPVAYMIEKKNKMFGEWMHIDHPERPLLAKKSVIQFENRYIHERLSVKPDYENQVEKFEAKIRHEAYNRISEKMEKIDQYASLEAVQHFENGRTNVLWYLYMAGGTFCYYLFLHKGVLDGYRGFIYSALEALQPLLAYEKILEIKELEKRTDEWKGIWLSEECSR